jgi:hypothetical protein
MRSRGFQHVLLVVVGGALIAGLTFARQWLASPMPQRPPKVDAPNAPKSFITFGGTTLAGINYEMKPTRGHQDLWFENNKDEDIELGLDQTSCKCAGVEVTLLTPEETEKLKSWLPIASATQWAAGAGGLLPETAAGLLCQQGVSSIFQEGSRWQHMMREKLHPEPFRVPSKSAGLLRLEWEGRKTGPERIVATVWTQSAGNEPSRVYTGLEMPIVFVSPLMVVPSQAQVELGSGDHKTVSFYCWSATRAGFRLSAREESSHPCFSCTCVPLVGPEYQLAMQAIKGQQPPSILFGYRVAITVAERSDNGAQLDLGHFNRRIILTSPDLELASGSHEYPVSLQGRVQGEVSVGGPRDHDQVNLGIYAKTRGTTKEVPVETLKPGLKLKRIDHTPPFLDVQLKDERATLEGYRYRMTVNVPKNQSYLPEDSAIILETVDNPPRKVRIPVSGTATIPIRQGP